METKKLPLSQVYEDRNNPRIISDAKFQKLIDSILAFPKMLSLRPVVIDGEHNSLGGNMRLRSLNSISQMTLDAIKQRLETIKDYTSKSADEQKQVVKYWKYWLKKPTVETADAADLTEDERKQFMIKDNVSVGDWDWQELLTNWDTAQLETWGLDTELPNFEGGENWGGQNQNPQRTITETEKLSEVKFVDAYYQPKEQPDITLRECIDTELFEKKIAFVNSLSLSDEMKEVMRLLAYRFIRIDFESVANYYAFNATEEEKRAIERLRCVLVDGSLDGFIGDSLLRVHEHFYNEESGEDIEDLEDEENG